MFSDRVGCRLLQIHIERRNHIVAQIFLPLKFIDRFLNQIHMGGKQVEIRQRLQTCFSIFARISDRMDKQIIIRIIAFLASVTCNVRLRQHRFIIAHNRTAGHPV